MTPHFKLNLLTIVLLLFTTMAFAQKKGDDQILIRGDLNIKKYHDREELEAMQKGKLLDLYNIRIEIIINILPNIAFASKPGVTMTSLGIPDTKDNRKALKENLEATTTYFDNTIEFQKMVLPYSDKSNLIAAILFYEETLKALHTYNDFN
ncbi:hypothetical protein [Ulvibacter antarcticus]|uniref:Uncharacterized protein n=1 Tax=Ulvibacter antarcticus TaxID=442714 RepID=A0A3L9ZCI8_9FLAO|nr:hypothetical protein [Ulvibacter antarcticus]RMA64362.1 hypothetical protein BXY75_1237 [Ulvibacter antarcticus]